MAARRSAAARCLPRRGCERRGLPRKTALTSPSSPSLGPMSSPTRELAVLDNDGFHSGGGGRTSATNKAVKRARDPSEALLFYFGVILSKTYSYIGNTQ
uniref:Uncharacterized protein n=1 Tax=Oryza rufipogon TaxID=4529 RepID=A0A0E0MT28_ORYRU